MLSPPLRDLLVPANTLSALEMHCRLTEFETLTGKFAYATGHCVHLCIYLFVFHVMALTGAHLVLRRNKMVNVRKTKRKISRRKGVMNRRR